MPWNLSSNPSLAVSCPHVSAVRTYIQQDVSGGDLLQTRVFYYDRECWSHSHAFETQRTTPLFSLESAGPPPGYLGQSRQYVLLKDNYIIARWYTLMPIYWFSFVFTPLGEHVE